MDDDREYRGEVIVSASNPVIKRIRSLQRRKTRLQERAFVVEGVRAVDDALEQGRIPDVVMVREGSTWRPEDRAVSVRTVDARLFDSLSDVPHPQGVLAIVPMMDSFALPDPESAPCVVVLDAVRDPGNMGTLLRSAAGAGVSHVVLAPECVDPYHPKAVRAAMGALGRVPFSNASWVELGAYLATFPVVALADANGSMAHYEVDWRGPCVMIIGSEAFGPGSEAHALARLVVSIPMANCVESLNAAVAGSLLMFEAARQRRG